MPPSISSLTSRWGADTGALRFFWRAGPVAIVHLAALIVLFQTEYYDVPRIGSFLLTWGFLNFAWLAVLALARFLEMNVSNCRRLESVVAFTRSS